MTSPIRLRCEHGGRPLVKTLEIEKSGEVFLVQVCAPCSRLMDGGGTAICKLIGGIEVIEELDAVKDTTSPRPWHVSFEAGHHGTPGEPDEAGYCEGIVDAEGNWVVRFEDDYGTDQWANADLIVTLVNAASDLKAGKA